MRCLFDGLANGVEVGNIKVLDAVALGQEFNDALLGHRTCYAVGNPHRDVFQVLLAGYPGHRGAVGDPEIEGVVIAEVGVLLLGNADDAAGDLIQHDDFTEQGMAGVLINDNLLGVGNNRLAVEQSADGQLRPRTRK